MRVLVTLEHRFQRTPDGSVWTSTNNSYEFWSRYLDVFNEVNVMARVLDVREPEPRWRRADGHNVTFMPVPYFVGPRQYARSYPQIRRALKAGMRDVEAVIMRVPSLFGNLVSNKLVRAQHPFGLEVVGDPGDVFAPSGTIRHPLRPLFRQLFSSRLRRQCRQAQAVAYVTEHTLQARYPAPGLMVGISDVQLPPDSFVTSYSSVELRANQLLAPARMRVPMSGEATLVWVGTLDQLYKAPDHVLQATAKAVQSGCELRLRIVGDGRYRAMLENMASDLGILGRCDFLGHLPSGDAVQRVLDTSDVFVSPSLAEGLPRAMIEAMARGLPCIGSTVGGIPELLETEDMIKPGDIDALSAKILDLVNNPARRHAMSIRNLRRASGFADDALKGRRVEFYRHVADFTARALSSRKGFACPI